MLTASCTVSGSGRPAVSGNRRAARPPTQLQQPIIKNGSSGFVDASEAIVGANKPPTLADVEQRPIAEFLTGVGNSSAVKMKTIANDADAPNLPIKVRIVVKVARWAGIRAAVRQVVPARIWLKARIPLRPALSRQEMQNRYAGISIVADRAKEVKGSSESPAELRLNP